MDERIKKTPDSNRVSRAAEERTSADESLNSSMERRRMFREFSQEALPNVPPVPGWHFVWLSTTNQYDPIHKRVRMGYEPVKAEEMPDFNNFRVKSGEFEGLISVNEMVLFKIPTEIYQEIMEEYHFNMPMEEEERIKSNALLNERDSNGTRLGSVEGDGIGSLAQRVKTPVFQ